MTLHDPHVQSAVLAAAGLLGFVASAASYTHAACPRSPECPDHKPRHFWIAAYFAGVMLMGMAYFAGWAPAPPPAAVWLCLCGAGWAGTHAAKLGRAYFKTLGRERELPLFGRLTCFWLLFAASVGIPLVAASLPGCQTNPAYTPQEKAVVLAERALKANFETLDAFLLFDDENRAWMRLKLPEVHAFAERLRKPGADGVQAVVSAQRAAWRAHDAWAESPTPANAAAFDVAAEQVRAWAQQARKYLETSR